MSETGFTTTGGGDARSESPDPVRIIGIGASAGGLAALQALFSALPERPGGAFVVVVHLAAERESRMADLLQPYCAMPVEQVTGSVALAPDRVYVVPPNAHLNAIDSHLRLSELEPRAAERAPIDHFFRTLAASHDGNCLGIVLTGLGSDGTEGLGRIRDSGGRAVVQDPEEAVQQGMPASAIAAGVAERVLPLSGICDEILAFCRPGSGVAVTGKAGNDEPLAGRVLPLLNRSSGLDLSWYRSDLVSRAVERRMGNLLLTSTADYESRLKADPEEGRLLLEELLQRETVFFPESGAFPHLERQVVPQLFQGQPDPEGLRVWSVGCSTGEEAYSLAMLLLEEAERHPLQPPIRLFATEVRETALRSAREGVYPADIAERVSASRLQRFFVPDSGHYRVRREVRDQVVFTPHHLVEDPPFLHLDLIVCCGTFDALASDRRRSVVELFHHALRPGGLLVLDAGHVIEAAGLFEPVDGAPGVLRQVDPHPSKPHHRSQGWFPSTAGVPAHGRGVAHTRRRSPADHDAVFHAALARHAPPGLLIDDTDQVVRYSARANRFLLMPGGIPTHHLFELVPEPLRGALRGGVDEVRQTGRPWHSAPIETDTADGPRRLVLVVEPAQDAAEALWLVAFHEAESSSAAGDASRAGTQRQDLALGRRQLDAALEMADRERQRANDLDEELQSVTEEFQAVVEELHGAKEELQSANEELITLNQENLHRVEELSQLSADQQHLLTATGIATLFLDRRLRIARFTPAAEKLFRLRHEDRGRRLADLARLADGPLAGDAERVLEHAQPAEREIQLHDGRWYLCRALPYRGSGGRPEGVVVSLIDIHERRQAEQALMEADRRKDQFLATLAHELRNPLAPIRTGLELLSRLGDDEERRADILRRLDRQTRQLVRLVDDLLDVSRITRGVFDLHRERVSLADVVRDAIAACESQLSEAHHELTVDLPDEPVILEVDAARLTQVLSNLLSNAAKYTPEAGHVRVQARRLETAVEISVTDTGLGIPPDSLERIFDMFTQIDVEPRSAYGGLGIGLSLARSLVEMHGGTLKAESGGRGRGAEFYIWLPLTPGEAGEAREEARAETAVPSGAQRLLIADDNEDAVATLALLVQTLGDHEVHTARDGVEALALARQLEPDIMLLDIGMPGMDGYEVARHIREEPWGRSVTLAALTGWGQASDRQRTQAAGFDHHLVKPADLESLKAVLAEHEGHDHQRQR